MLHKTILEHIRKDITSDKPQFTYPEMPRLKAVREGVKDALRDLGMNQEMRSLNSELAALKEELKQATTPKSPTGRASPLTIQVFKHAELARIRSEISKQNQKIDAKLGNSEKTFLESFPEIKATYALIAADLANQAIKKNQHIDKKIDKILGRNQGKEDYTLLRTLRAHMIQVQAEIEHQVEKLKSDPQANQVQAEIEHQVEELKSAPQANPDAIISNANKLADLAGRFDKEWEKICEDFKQTTGLDLLSSPSDPEQPQRSPDTPSSGRSSPTK